MAITGWLDITYTARDAVVAGWRVNTEQNVILHARGFSVQPETQSSEVRAGPYTEITHFTTLDVLVIEVPRIKAGVGLDEDGASRHRNVDEMLRAARRGEVLFVQPTGEHYGYRMAGAMNAVLIPGSNPFLQPDDIYPRFSLSMRLRQNGLGGVF